MDTSASDGAARQPLADGHPNIVPDKAEDLRPSTPTKAAAGPNVEAKLPATPTRKVDKPLPKEPAKTPRTKKKVPWKGKNILVLLPRDDERGLPGMPPKPLRQSDIDKMFASWEELGYSTNGFDHVVEGYQPPGTDDSQSRDAWPTSEDLVRERSERTYKVTLPDLNAWRDYVNELQEAKLRALGVSMAEEEPPAPPSPGTTNPSRQASAQYPPNPFSPPLPASSASSNQAALGYPFNQQQFNSAAAQSPGVISPVSFAAANGKTGSVQHAPFGASSPFQFSPTSHQWQAMQGINRSDSPSFANLSGMMSPQSPFGIDGIQPTGSPAFNVHQRQQSQQYSMLPHQQPTRASPRLHEVREDEEDGAKSTSKTPEAHATHYHLEEQLREQLEHDDYNPQIAEHQSHQRQQSEKMQVPEHFANEPGKPMVLHHPRPHSRGHSLTQNLFNNDDQLRDRSDQAGSGVFAPLNGIPETQKGDDAHEIETNPSDLGTPNPNFDASAAFGQHHRTVSTVSNPWNDAEPSSGNRRSGHGSRSSLSKFNVNAPEFKFNPESTFTPGRFSFSGSAFQPTAFQAGDVSFDDSSADQGKEDAVPPADSTAEISFEAPAEAPKNIPAASPQPPVAAFTGLSASEGESSSTFGLGQSEFNFSSSGPKFRPDAPSFTPFQTINRPPSVESKHLPRDSIFGNIRVNTDEIVKPAKKSKAIPIIRPNSRSSAKSPRILDSSEEGAVDDDDGRLADDSRAKRAKSQAPDGDDVPLFAEQPKDIHPTIAEADETEKTHPESGAVPEQPAEDEADNILPADTSMSSAATGEHIDTKTTTAAPSESSPAEANISSWSEFDSKFGDARLSGDDTFKESAAEPSLPTLVDTPVEKDAASTENASPERSHSPTPQPKSTTPQGLGLGSSRFDTPPSKPKGLASSRFASEATPPSADRSKDQALVSVEQEPVQEPLVAADQADTARPSVESDGGDGEQTYGEVDDDEIDAVMQELGNNPSLGVNKTTGSSSMAGPLDHVSQSPSLKLEPPSEQLLSARHPRGYRQLSDAMVPGPEQPAVAPVDIGEVPSPRTDDDEDEPRSPVVSDWENDFSADEHDKLESRAQFFDGRVNEVVGTLLASRLEPLEHALFSIQDALSLKSGRPTSSRRDAYSVSDERRHSDADDEDEEPVPRRSMSPRRDRRMDQIRAAVLEGLAAHHRTQPTAVSEEKDVSEPAFIKDIVEMKQLLANNTRSEPASDELRNLIETAVQSRMPPPPEPDADLVRKMESFQSKIEDLEDRLQAEQDKLEKETDARRAAEDTFADLHRQLQAAETRVEVEIINKSVFDQRVADLEEKLRNQEAQTEQQVESRRQAEDRLSEVQRLLRIASEEEVRLRETTEEQQQKIRSMEQASGKASMKMALLEASQNNSTQSQSELTNKANVLEADLKAVRQDNNHWRAEAERSDEAARRRAGELAHAQEENKHLHKSLNTLTTQLEENERLRESWRSKFLSLQDDMARAAREIAEENARRIKKDQAMLARQEVLEARLQAEAKTRERLEVEMERLQSNERTGMRATKECERLEGLLGEMRTENHSLQQRVLGAQREVEEVRESGASEIKRARVAIQAELDSANLQVNAVREELEEQNNKLRSELDSFKLEADTAKARSEMLLEEAETSKESEIEALQKKHRDELEDVQAQHERQRSMAVEEAQRNEQNLLERLSFSASKIDHLQDRILHLEEKLEISKEAAAAAAAAAKSAGVDTAATSNAGDRSKAAPIPAPAARYEVAEKISPQALRESIMVLQEQLQAREQRIEELEQTVSKADPDAPAKISKRDDEISWLRELLAVRHGDLQDIITTLSSEAFDRNRVKDATIRLKANLQMEEQERERAMNGGSAITLPNIAQSIQTATPKVAQTIGAAWGSWRKGSTGSFSSSIGGRFNSPGSARNATPSRPGPSSQHGKPLGGLMTPPASSVRQNPLADDEPQPTAFGSTGRRFPSHGSTSNPGHERRLSHTSARATEKMPADEPASGTQEELAEPRTPPMMRPAVYDSDAQPGDFDDDGFFEDE